ncbi:methyltransferase domain-containing protein [candidate division WOR-3 bacterium]|uniref:Methyltransferase domain-containing protein n=1 Tax=candidate division WOR-3 bacterium TaxID=2052148 RepID=A0A9D5KBD3_UNCW3|nr:methyltransferase domain-containing protein [candidate division WOR-3 bacterium]MBD3365615.1 methyltransferase domain-containing protein [candidate division WOR-3 bacterium]
MHEDYVSREEYCGYFGKLEGLRTKVAACLPLKPDTQILDIATGYGFFAFEISEREPSVKVVGIDISQSDVDAFNKRIESSGLGDRLSGLKMDVSEMSFSRERFDMVVNFLGLEDVHMTRGKQGIEDTFSEVARVVKSGGYLCFCVMPAEEAETEAQQLEIEVFSWLCSATWLPAADYEKMLTVNGFNLISRKTFYTGKKLTVAQAAEEIRFACENVPRIYGVKTPSFDEVWARFGSRIERHGMGHYSRVVSMTARKKG